MIYASGAVLPHFLQQVSNSHSILIQDARLEGTVIRKDGVVNEQKVISTKTDETQLRSREDLTAVHFLNETHGWVGGSDSLYKTEDGGTSWQEVKITVPENAHVNNILFVSPAVGWVTLQRSSPFAIDYQQNHFWLEHTIDGGAKLGVAIRGRRSISNSPFLRKSTEWMAYWN